MGYEATNGCHIRILGLIDPTYADTRQCSAVELPRVDVCKSGRRTSIDIYLAFMGVREVLPISHFSCDVSRHVVLFPLRCKKERIKGPGSLTFNLISIHARRATSHYCASHASQTFALLLTFVQSRCNVSPPEIQLVLLQVSEKRTNYGSRRLSCIELCLSSARFWGINQSAARSWGV